MMENQQRLFLSIGLCMLILLGWKVLFPTSLNPKYEENQNKVNNQKISSNKKPKTQVENNKKNVLTPKKQENTLEFQKITSQEKAIETDKLSLKIANKDLRITKLNLKDYKVSKENNKTGLVSLLSPHINGESYQAIVQFQLDDIPAPKLNFDQVSENTLNLKGHTKNIYTNVKIETQKELYALTYTFNIHNKSDIPIHSSASIKIVMQDLDVKESSFLQPQIDILNAICKTSDDINRFDISDLEEESFESNNAKWAAIDRQYFIVGVIGENIGRCKIHLREKEIVVEYFLKSKKLHSQESLQDKITLYVGPKQNQALQAVSTELKEMIDYNIWGIPLGFIARPMIYSLNVFYEWIGSWGGAIILLTFVIKLILFPISYKSAVSMRRMQLLKPELDALKERFPDNKERQQTEQLKLFKERGVNPLGGCLPMLLQMPVWLALYRSLWTAVDLYQQPFLWISDLTSKETGFPVLAIILGILTYVQQIVTPVTTDNQQTKIMRWIMPGMFVFIMITLPSGLVLYILVNSILTILQQVIINKKITNPMDIKQQQNILKPKKP